MAVSQHTIFPLRETRRVYCAGPLFNDSERREMVGIAEVLRSAGFEPFLPHADGLEFSKVQPYLAASGYDAAAAGQVLHEAVFALDVYQVAVGCGSLVLNMNGRVPDEGAVAEAAIAWALGKPIVIYKEDCRSKVAGRDNPLVVGLTGFVTLERIESLGEALATRQAQMAPDPDLEVPCPAHLGRAIEAGARLWQALQTLGDARPAAPVAQMIMELFGTPPRSDCPLLLARS